MDTYRCFDTDTLIYNFSKKNLYTQDLRMIKDPLKPVMMTMRLLVLALLSLHSVSAFFPYFRTFTYTRRPARPHNPIIVQADRVKVRGDEIKIFCSF